MQSKQFRQRRRKNKSKSNAADLIFSGENQTTSDIAPGSQPKHLEPQEVVVKVLDIDGLRLHLNAKKDEKLSFRAVSHSNKKLVAKRLSEMMK